LSVDLLLPGDRAAFLDANTSRRMGRGTDLVGRRKDGTEVPIQVSLSFMQRQGTPMVVAFVSDVSEQRKRELEIRTYQDRLQRMSFDAAVTEEQERRRIAVQLHDGIGQDLALARMELATVQNQLEGKPRAIVAAVMATLKGAIDSSSALVFDLSPPILYDLGLEKAVAWLADDVRTRHGMTIEVADDGTHKPLDEAAKAIVFRAIRELVMNVLKHAKVAAAKVSLQRVGNQYHIDVLDSGVGFDPSAQTAPTSFGLLSVHEQVARLGGTMKLESAPQQGTRISLAIPLASDQVTP
jgi:signal transduction histidine kinase